MDMELSTSCVCITASWSLSSGTIGDFGPSWSSAIGGGLGSRGELEGDMDMMGTMRRSAAEGNSGGCEGIDDEELAEVAFVVSVLASIDRDLEVLSFATRRVPVT